MYCPRCANETTKVYGTSKGLVNIRYRKCPKCEYSFTTKEIPKVDLLAVEYLKYLEDIKEVTSEEVKKAVIKGEEC